jgi:hypothetical protein
MAKTQDSYTHRLGWKLLRGPIPEGKELHHRCGVYACWNPDHLQVVTHRGAVLPGMSQRKPAAVTCHGSCYAGRFPAAWNYTICVLEPI